jgi:hypothetical protein
MESWNACHPQPIALTRLHSFARIMPKISYYHCVHRVESTVGEIKGVRAVQADETTHQEVVEWEGPACWDQIAQVLIDDYPPAKS